MSKIQLRKALDSFTRDQLLELVLESYEASKEVKTYFDYFINPDVNKLYTRYVEALNRELRRGKRTKSKTRTSVVKRLLKEFASFHPGFDKEIALRVSTIKEAVVNDGFLHFSEAQRKAFAQICIDTLKLADRNLCLENVLTDLLPYFYCKECGTKAFRECLLAAVEEADFGIWLLSWKLSNRCDQLI